MVDAPIVLPEAFWELRRGLPRQGPGDDSSTRRAFRALGRLPERPRVADIGCGPGMQTLELARLTRGTITAVDLFPEFLEELRRRAEREGLAERIETLQGDMAALPFPEGSIDLFWSEGAVYLMGFEAALSAWRPMLRPGGALVCSEASWLREDAPEEPVRFWKENYPAMGSSETNTARAVRAGYEVVVTFPLPAESWWTHYYTPIEERLPGLRRRYADDPESLAALDAEVEEIELHRRFGRYYGYVFYVMRRAD